MGKTYRMKRGLRSIAEKKGKMKLRAIRLLKDHDPCPEKKRVSWNRKIAGGGREGPFE